MLNLTGEADITIDGVDISDAEVTRVDAVISMTGGAEVEIDGTEYDNGTVFYLDGYTTDEMIRKALPEPVRM